MHRATWNGMGCDVLEVRDKHALIRVDGQQSGSVPGWVDVMQLGPTTGVKHDQGKLRLDLVPVEAVEALAAILGFGATKYGEQSWQGVERGLDRYYAAALRHLFAWRKGESKDSESGLSHLAHALCCLAFMVWMEGREKP